MNIRLRVFIRSFWIFVALALASCGDPVPEYDGFNKNQVEFLLAGTAGKVWQLTSRTVDDQMAEVDPCEEGGLLVFLPDSRNDNKPLLYAYDPTVCDSLTFCNAFPGYCMSDTSICNQNPALCQGFDGRTLFIGYWEVKKPLITNARTDTVFVHLWEGTRTMHINKMTASLSTFKYERPGSEIVNESYFWINAE